MHESSTYIQPLSDQTYNLRQSLTPKRINKTSVSMCVAATGWKSNTRGAAGEADTEAPFMVYNVSVVCSVVDAEVVLRLRLPLKGI